MTPPCHLGGQLCQENVQYGRTSPLRCCERKALPPNYSTGCVQQTCFFVCVLGRGRVKGKGKGSAATLICTLEPIFTAGSPLLLVAQARAYVSSYSFSPLNLRSSINVHPQGNLASTCFSRRTDRRNSRSLIAVSAYTHSFVF